MYWFGDYRCLILQLPVLPEYEPHFHVQLPVFPFALYILYFHSGDVLLFFCLEAFLYRSFLISSNSLCQFRGLLPEPLKSHSGNPFLCPYLVFSQQFQSHPIFLAPFTQEAYTHTQHMEIKMTHFLKSLFFLLFSIKIRLR